MRLWKFTEKASSYPILNFLYQENLDCGLDRDPTTPRPGVLKVVCCAIGETPIPPSRLD